MKRRFRRNPRQVPDTAELRDRELAARLPELEQRLRTATAALEEGCLAGVLPSDVRSRYHAVSDAYNAAVLAAEAGHRVAVGSTAGRPYTHVIAARRRPAALAARRVLEQLCTKRQGHLLDATLEVRIPTSVRVSSLAALGPHIPDMHFDPAQPLGPSVTAHLRHRPGRGDGRPVDHDGEQSRAGARAGARPVGAHAALRCT